MDVIVSSADDSIDERMAKATEKLEAEFSKVDTKISRFPRGMRGIGGGQDGSFIEPSVVAIGPYHHGAPHLQKMEEVKLAAAYNLCRSSGHSRAEAYGKVLSVAGAARDCYDADDPAVMGVSDADFATMMFLDGCFLLHYMVAGDTAHVLHSPVVRRQILSMGLSIHKDIFLLENQIPWLVLDALTVLVPVDVRGFVYRMGHKFHARRSSAARVRGGNVGHYKPPHLLGLLRFTLVGCRPEPEVKLMSQYIYDCDPALEQPPPRSAVELVQIGVVVAPSTKPWFGDMNVRGGPLTGELSLSPLFLSHVTACCLVNMAAMETATSNGEVWSEDDGLEVSSYLSVLAMLMDKEEDVDLLQKRGVLHGSIRDMHALVFFKDLRHHLRLGGRHMVILDKMEAYMRYRPVRTTVHKCVYHNYYKIAAAIISITNIISSVCTVIQTFKSGSNK